MKGKIISLEDFNLGNIKPKSEDEFTIKVKDLKKMIKKNQIAFMELENEIKEKTNDLKTQVIINRKDLKDLYDFFEKNKILIKTNRGTTFKTCIAFGYLHGCLIKWDLDMLDDDGLELLIEFLNTLIVSKHKLVLEK
jgi:hypothetical protein